MTVRVEVVTPKEKTIRRWLGRMDTSNPDACWEWPGFRWPSGYGKVAKQWAGTNVAHRAVYSHLVGPIPEGLTLDHLCRNRGCVNPSHLEPVSNRENILRGDGLSAQRARQTHCQRGHPFDEVNTYYTGKGAQRICRACRAIYEKERRAATS